MYQVPSDNNLNIPETQLQDLLTDLNEFIGSKRLKSRIVNLKDLLDVIWKRNVWQTEEGERVAIIFTTYPGDVLNYYHEYLSRRPKKSNGELVNFESFVHMISEICFILRTIIPKT